MIGLIRKIGGVFWALPALRGPLAALQIPDARLRVLVTDKVAMSCHLLADALRRDRAYHATAAIPKKALQLLEHVRFDVLILALSADEVMTGASFIRQVRRLHPDMAVIVLLESRQRTLVVEALRSGARGVFCRSDSFESLRKCIRCVHAGQVWASATELEFVAEALFERDVKALRPDGARRLSTREEQITMLVAEGHSNRQISERLGLSEHTIKNYLFRIFEKVGVSTRVGLTLYMLKQGSGSRSQLAPVEQFPVSGPILLPGKQTEFPS
jgi:two-component system, NarL family, nitrate/nitrite response regulator NarL